VLAFALTAIKDWRVWPQSSSAGKQGESSRAREKRQRLIADCSVIVGAGEQNHDNDIEESYRAGRPCVK